MIIVNVEPPAPADATICNSTDFLIADNDYIGEIDYKQLPESLKILIPESLLYLKSFGRLQFVQSTWAGVDGLVKKAKGNIFFYKILTLPFHCR